VVRVGGELALATGPHSWYYHIIMAVNKKVVVPKKRRGRPFTGVDNRDPVTAIRLSPELRAQIDAWAARQEDKPARSEAIRRMIERQLAVDSTDTKPRRVSRKTD